MLYALPPILTALKWTEVMEGINETVCRILRSSFCQLKPGGFMITVEYTGEKTGFTRETAEKTGFAVEKYTGQVAVLQKPAS